MAPVPLSIRGLNHISRVCKDVLATARFYREVLGFVEIQRPKGLHHFEGAWLFHPSSSVGLHLIKGTPVERPAAIDPKADHLSFVVGPMALCAAPCIMRLMCFLRSLPG